MKTLRLLALAWLLSAMACRGQDVNFGAGWWSSTNATYIGSTNDYSPEILFPSPSYGNICGPFTVTSQTGQPVISEVATLELSSLAANLQNDPKRIFDYVHNNIRYVHYFGAKKGAYLTFLEGSGNDFDQCALFVALIRAASTNSGISYPVHYQFGLMEMPYSATNNLDMQHWFGFNVPPVSGGTSGTTLTEMLKGFNALRNYPYYEDNTGIDALIVAGDNTYNNFIFHRVWVRLTYGGTDYYLDPAFKISTFTPGINVTNAFGFNASNVFSNAASGATITTDYAQHLNWTNLSNKLTAYTTNLLSYLTMNSNLSVEQVISGYDVQQTISQTLPCLTFQPVTTFNGQDGLNGTIPILEWDNIPTNYMVNLIMQIDNINTNFFFPALQARKVSLTFTNISGNYQAKISLDDVVQVTGTSGSGSGTVYMTNTITHPTGYWDYTYNTIDPLARNNQNDTGGFGPPLYQRTAYGYAIAYGFDDVAQVLSRREQKLNALINQGVSSTDPRMITEGLNVMGLSWLNEVYLQSLALGAQKDDMIFWHHRAGRVAAESGYYIDMRLSINDFIWRDGLSAYGGYSSPSDPSPNITDFTQFVGSAMEHGVIEQLQGNTSMSTTKAIYQANQTGQKVILAQDNSTYNNSGTVSSLLSSETINNYGSDATTIMDLLYGSGGPMLVPSGHVINGSWTGYGAAIFYGLNQAMIIEGNYGGYPGTEVTLNPISLDGYTSLSAPTEFSFVPPAVPLSFVADPLNTADGSFAVDTVDLSAGQAEPRGFSFAHHYDSNRRNANSATMANGWTHNYIVNAVTRSDPDAGMGRNSPQEMAAFLAAERTGYEIFASTPTTNHPQSECWAIAALCAEWAVDNLKSNAVNVTLGTADVQFIKQPNGTYTPPAGITLTLAQSNSAYNLQTRHGNLFRFNASGFLTNISDQYNQALNVTYTSSNWVSTITDWKSRALAFTYAGTPSRLTSITNTGTGRAVNFVYSTNANGQLDLASVIDPIGASNSYVYDTNHQIIATKNALNQIVSSNVYDSFGHVVQQYSQGLTNQMWQGFWSGFLNVVVDPMGGAKEYFFDAQSRQVGLLDPLSNFSGTFYDGQNHVVMTVSPLDETNQFVYDGNNNLIETIDPLGYSNQFIYDGNFNLISTVDANSNSSLFGYNTKFQLLVSSNAMGDSVTNTYNSTNGLLATRSDAGGTVTCGYDSNGQLNSIIYPNNLGTNLLVNNALGDVVTNTKPRGFSTAFLYNLRRQLTNTIAPTNLTTTISYDAVGNVLISKDARSNSTSFTWSATRHQTSATLPLTPQGAPVVTNIYDSRDCLAKTFDPLVQPTTNSYDLAGRLLTITDPMLRTNSFSYDNDSRQTNATDAASETTLQQWNVRGQLAKLTDPATKTVLNAYDGNGNKVLLTNRNGKVWQFQFDAANRLTNTISPLSHTSGSSFNHRGLLQGTTDAMTQNTSVAYDGRGRLTNRTDNVAATTYQYDFNGNRTAVIESGLTNVSTFDAYDRISTYTDSGGNLIQYHYDPNGNLTSLIYPGNRTVLYSYDNLNRLTNVTDWASRTTTYTYDLDSHVTSITRPNGTVRSNFYDADGELTNMIEQTTTHAPIAFFKLHWNNAARMDWEFMAPTNQPYTPPSRTLAYDADNRLTNFNGAAIVNDANGNMTSGPLTNSSLVTYSYDARNRLTGAGGVSYGYDPANSRVAMTNGASVTAFVADPKNSQILMRIRNGVTNYYVYGLGLLYEEDDTATSTNFLTYHFDFRGSTVALTAPNGNVTDRIQYSAYGMTTLRLGTNDTPFQYCGRYGVQTDPNGLLYMRARYYNPYICRFINADPSGFSGGFNFYAYANGDPISLSDPFGLGAIGDNLGSLNFLNSATSLPGAVPFSNIVGNFTLSDYSGLGPIDFSTIQFQPPAPNPGTIGPAMSVGQYIFNQDMTIGSGLNPGSPSTTAFANMNALNYMTAPGTGIIGDVVGPVISSAYSSIAVDTALNRAFWMGQNGLAAAQADGANVLNLSPYAQAAFDAGNFAPMQAESAAWAAGARGTATVYVGNGAGRTFWNWELPQLLNNVNTGNINTINYIFLPK